MVLVASKAKNVDGKLFFFLVKNSGGVSGLFLRNVPINVRPLFSSSKARIIKVSQLSTVTLRLVL